MLLSNKLGKGDSIASLSRGGGSLGPAFGNLDHPRGNIDGPDVLHVWRMDDCRATRAATELQQFHVRPEIALRFLELLLVRGLVGYRSFEYLTAILSQNLGETSMVMLPLNAISTTGSPCGNYVHPTIAMAPKNVSGYANAMVIK
jgi:hypothetical protein